MKTILSIFTLLFFLLSTNLFCQFKITTIEDINNGHGILESDAVEFQGLVTQYVKNIASTSYYLIKGDFGGIIRVNTAEPAPETNTKYGVQGIVYIDKKNNTRFISEKRKWLIDFPEPMLLAPNSVEENESAKLSWNAETAVKVSLNGDLVEIKGTKSVPLELTTTFILQAQYPNGKFKEKTVIVNVIPQTNYLLYALITLLIFLIAAFVYFQFKKKTALQEPDQQSYYQTPPQARDLSPNMNFKEAEPIFSSDNDYKTIKIVKTSPKTLKFIPGKLVITNGVDKGREFRIAGYPTSDGFIVTIGRKEVSGDRAYAHIQLNEKTVSKEQAELRYQDNKLFVKNLSETNYTQLNGLELSPGQMSEITPGSTIRTGEVEFKFVI